ncbi:hypothetical protein [Cognatiyoonia sp. IB215182]|uniref:hypothetical protein n=1 Tax=Cognatiyoonia sp. IB215182 TaxID=3097353 RepID=UPI002A1194E9|nr:hypothetical protein [Cognatiyoonia sp. IB215182]MDX8355188.1 hypothetical protein [Cognatiyoonia sp. IB215182]
MLSQLGFLLIGPLVFSVSLASSPAFAQNQHSTNVFFGFDLVLHPLAVKWACGGQRDQDLSQINTLTVAFPKDAEQAGLGLTVATLSEMASGLEGLSQILGAELDGQQMEQLCEAALPLNIDWVTPQHLVNEDEISVPSEQMEAWAEFWQVIESLH